MANVGERVAGGGSSVHSVPWSRQLREGARARRHHAPPRDHQPHRHLSHPGAPPRQPLVTLLGDVLRCLHIHCM